MCAQVCASYKLGEMSLQVDFIGSDGKVYRFLAKPKDDLRKDNRMMEVASILNGLFAKDPASRRRNLLIRRLVHPARSVTIPNL